VDPQIDELKELVRRSIALAEDTNRTLHKMRRGAIWGRVFSLLFWIIVIVVPTVAAYYYFAPYINSIHQLYDSIQSGVAKTASTTSAVGGFFKQF
jgi:hypothetical protein